MEVTVSNLRCSFGSVAAVDDISFTVPSGTITALLGPSGCGKTTTLRCLAGLAVPQAGTIRFGERTVYSSDRRLNLGAEQRRLGMIFQDFALWPHLRVFDNVAFGLRMARVPRAQVQNRVMAALALVQLEGLAHRYPHELSGGQQQRVAVARAVVTEPGVLLLDEPLSSLDAGLREDMRQELAALIHRLRITAVHVTHDHLEALSMAQQVIVLNKGRIEQAGTPVDVYSHPQNLFVAGFLGVVNVITGTVEGTGDTLRVSGPGWSVRGRMRQPVSGRAHALVRPAAVRIANEAEPVQENCLAGVVKGGSFYGDRWQYQVSTSAEVTFKIFADRPLPSGGQVRLTFSLDACQIIPASS